MQKTQELLLIFSYEERDAASSGRVALEEIRQNGRLAILKARSAFQAEEIAAFRGYCQTINPIYQKKNQKVKRIQRQEHLLEEAGLQ